MAYFQSHINSGISNIITVDVIYSCKEYIKPEVRTCILHLHSVWACTTVFAQQKFKHLHKQCENWNNTARVMVSKIPSVTNPVPQLHMIMSIPPFCFINLHKTVSHDKNGLQSWQSRTDISCKQQPIQLSWNISLNNSCPMVTKWVEIPFYWNQESVIKVWPEAHNIPITCSVSGW